MEDLKSITANNIIKLRTNMGLTQAQLAEMLSYSDKSVSKWERADALPDAYVLKKMSEIFNVSVDYILTPHNDMPKKPKTAKPRFHKRVITSIAVAGVWTLALLVFIIFWIIGSRFWFILVYAAPASLITLLVLNSVLEKGKNNFFIIYALIFSIFAAIYFTFISYNWWQLLILIIPAELIAFLCSRIKNQRK